jgi:hypothetical protein
MFVPSEQVDEAGKDLASDCFKLQPDGVNNQGILIRC